MVVLDKLRASWYDKKHHLALGDTIQNYTLIKQIGEGRYGKVYLGINDTTKVIIKQLKREAFLRSPEKIKFELETLKTIADLKDPRFPVYLGRFKLEYVRGFIFDFKEGDSIEYLLCHKKVRYHKPEIREFALQILDMLEVLHSKNIVHKDIRIPNLILHKGKLSLIDFGLARFIDNKRYKTELDFWYLGDFIIHLLYYVYDTAPKSLVDKPWYKQLDLTAQELYFLKRLMRVERKTHPKYETVAQIRNDLLSGEIF
uniref:YbdM n=1 Tax=Candidatus Epulonipiscium viviparus TaxID=420336 RepID=G9HVY8_9FIRM|nr:YbdM [Candidatus Epulopiscium viviparus]